MPKIKLEFGKGSWPALDEATTDGALPAMFIDGYQDEQGTRFKRPGTTQFGSAGAIALPVQGIFWSITLQKFVVVGNGRIYTVDSAGTVVATTGDVVPFGQPARFTEDTSLVYVTAGGKIVSSDGITASILTDIAAPTVVSHLTWLDSHIIANEVGTGRFWWTDAASTVWSGTNYANADASIDKIVAIGAGWRELVLLGRHSTEIWYNSGETPATFRRMEGAFIERGCSAPYSLMKLDNTWFWLDHERQFIRLDGRSPKVISGPVNRILRELPSVDDLVCSPFQYLNQHFILLSSATTGTSLIYDYVLDAWYQWGQWDSTVATYKPWPIHSISFSPELNRYLALGFDGKVYTITGEATDARFCLRTAHLSFGTYVWKLMNCLQIRAKRGYVPDTSEPKFWVRWRDQNKGWSNEHYISLNKMGEYNNIVELFRLGRAKTRQFEFCQTDVAPFAFVGAELDIEGEQ